MSVPKINLKPSTVPRAQANNVARNVARKAFNNVGGTILDTAFSAGSQYISGYISDYWNKKAEARADKRWRKNILDQPALTMAGRRAAGLNPYGDAQIPGMVGESSTDTSSTYNGSFTQRDVLLEQMNLEKQRVANDTLVADSQANRNNAEADRLRGQEGRDVDTFDLQKSLLQANVTSAEENAKILSIEREIKQATKETEIQYSQERLNKVVADISYVNEMKNKAITAQNVDKSLVAYYGQMVDTMKAQVVLMCAQKALVEQNIDLMSWQTEFAKEEFAWYNGDKSVNGVSVPGLWQTAYQLQSANVEQLKTLSAYYQMFVDKMPEWKQKEIEIMAVNAYAAYKQALAAQKNASAYQQQVDVNTAPLILKLLGAIMVVGGVAAAPFTGGVSIPLVGAGTGLYLGAGLGTSD